jgi:hypothetical protein
MNELIITIMLVIPSPSKIVNWSVNKVPTQIQIIHESGLEVSYNAAPVSCKFRPRNSNEMMFRSSREHCYAVYDLDKPRFVRHPYFWHKIQLSENKVTGE